MEERKQIMLLIDYFVYRKCSDDWVCIPQTISFSNLVWVIAGSGCYTINNVEYKVEAGDMVYIPFGSYRVARTDKDNLMIIYALDLKMYDADGSVYDLPLPSITRISEDKQLETLYSELNSIWTLRTPHFGLRATCIVYQIIERLLEIQNKQAPRMSYKDERVRQITDFILANIHQRITTKDIAVYLHLHPNYVNKILKRETGFTLVNYINYLKIISAENVIRNESHITMEEVAHQVGIEDYAYFSRLFRKIKGYPPTRIKGKRR